MRNYTLLKAGGGVLGACTCAVGVFFRWRIGGAQDRPRNQG